MKQISEKLIETSFKTKTMNLSIPILIPLNLTIFQICETNPIEFFKPNIKVLTVYSIFAKKEDWNFFAFFDLFENCFKIENEFNQCLNVTQENNCEEIESKMILKNFSGISQNVLELVQNNQLMDQNLNKILSKKELLLFYDELIVNISNILINTNDSENKTKLYEKNGIAFEKFAETSSSQFQNIYNLTESLTHNIQPNKTDFSELKLQISMMEIEAEKKEDINNLIENSENILNIKNQILGFSNITNATNLLLNCFDGSYNLSLSELEIISSTVSNLLAYHSVTFYILLIVEESVFTWTIDRINQNNCDGRNGSTNNTICQENEWDPDSFLQWVSQERLKISDINNHLSSISQTISNMNSSSDLVLKCLNKIIEERMIDLEYFSSLAFEEEYLLSDVSFCFQIRNYSELIDLEVIFNHSMINGVEYNSYESLEIGLEVGNVVNIKNYTNQLQLTEEECYSTCLAGGYYCKKYTFPMTYYQCVITEAGYYSPEGEYMEAVCINAGTSEVVYTEEGWTNSSCPFLCSKPKYFKTGGQSFDLGIAECIEAPIGTYSPALDNNLYNCTFPFPKTKKFYIFVSNSDSDNCTTNPRIQAIQPFPLDSWILPNTNSSNYLLTLNSSSTIQMWINITSNQTCDPVFGNESEFNFFGVNDLWHLSLVSSNDINCTSYFKFVVYDNFLNTSYQYLSRNWSFLDGNVPHFSIDPKFGSNLNHFNKKFTHICITTNAQNEIFMFVDSEFIGKFQFNSPVISNQTEEDFFWFIGGNEPRTKLLNAQLDEIMIFHEMIPTQFQGFFFTQNYYEKTCSPLTEKMINKEKCIFQCNVGRFFNGSSCECDDSNHEICLGKCVPKCPNNMMRKEEDCNCICEADSVEVWFTQTVVISTQALWNSSENYFPQNNEVNGNAYNLVGLNEVEFFDVFGTKIIPVSCDMSSNYSPLYNCQKLFDNWKENDQYGWISGTNTSGYGWVSFQFQEKIMISRIIIYNKNSTFGIRKFSIYSNSSIVNQQFQEDSIIIHDELVADERHVLDDRKNTSKFAESLACFSCSSQNQDLISSTIFLSTEPRTSLENCQCVYGTIRRREKCLGPMPAPTLYPPSGDYLVDSINITASSNIQSEEYDPPILVKYTIDGSPVTQYSADLISFQPPVFYSTIITAANYQEGRGIGLSAVGTYTIFGKLIPEISPESGTYVTNISLNISCKQIPITESSPLIRFSLDNGENIQNYSDPLFFNTSSSVKEINVSIYCSSSFYFPSYLVSKFTIVPKVPNPEILFNSLPNQTFYNEAQAHFQRNNSFGEISSFVYYSIDNQDLDMIYDFNPVNYTFPIRCNETSISCDPTIYFVGKYQNWGDSDIMQITIHIEVNLTDLIPSLIDVECGGKMAYVANPVVLSHTDDPTILTRITTDNSSVLNTSDLIKKFQTSRRSRIF
ncbi:hypothetical protein M0811_07421 [Anaeramoeba ignava]|uniref:Uncharacterized protein n=1 Tax=Anaeramoeba ignava TaxID=1746090 RepID=A0A9Q0LMP4_ANAIG|nr:hypothetical protein M0811_07421 [Anaeramoeba ignava]